MFDLNTDMAPRILTFFLESYYLPGVFSIEKPTYKLAKNEGDRRPLLIFTGFCTFSHNEKLTNAVLVKKKKEKTSCGF